MIPKSDELAIGILGLGDTPPTKAWPTILKMAQAVLDDDDPRRDA